MKKTGRILTVAAATAAVLGACGEGPLAGPAAADLEVRLLAPSQIPEKRVVDIEARVVRADGVDYPIVVTFEKANVGEPYNGAGFIVLRSPEERIAIARLPIFKDPTIRATARDASGLESVSEATIDVLEYP